MTNILSQTLANIVINQPRCAKIFEQLGLDYCCGGKISLEEACKTKGIDIEVVLKAINHSNNNDFAESENNLFDTSSITGLIDNILKVHHAYLIKVMPYISTLLDKVVKAHAANHPELLEIQTIYTLFRNEMEQHLAKEESVLFPMLKELDNKTCRESLISVSQPIHVMEAEHGQA